MMRYEIPATAPEIEALIVSLTNRQRQFEGGWLGMSAQERTYRAQRLRETEDGLTRARARLAELAQAATL